MLIALTILCAAAALVWLLVLYDNGQGGFVHRPASPRADEEWADGSLRTVHFPASDGTRLEGWLFRPRG